MKILIKNVKLLSMAEEIPNIIDIDILIQDDKIIKIEKNINEPANKIIDGNGKVAMPGLINTHTHVGMSIFRGYKDELKLMDWLEHAIFPKEAMLTPEDVYISSMHSCVEMLKTGTTTFCDMYLYPDQTIRAVKETGMRALISGNITDSDIKQRDTTIKKIDENLENIADSQDKIKLIMAMHAPYTCSPETIKMYLEVAKMYNQPINIHLSETKEETNIIKERYGKTSTQYLKDLGVFEQPVILPHGVHLSQEDIEILKDIKGGISHNPISNCKLASGVCDIVTLRKNKIKVGIGTDGQGSTTTLDMFEEMKIAAYLQKLKYEDPTIIKAYDILKMATIEGAEILGIDSEVGTIEVGKKADIILIDTQKAHLIPENDITINLVYACNGSDVDTVIINGEIQMENRKLINIQEEKIYENTRKIAKNIL